ncbi:MAG: dephospho-CoA kinase [Candidatus Omnitrophica bacterium]|nr:dephospho-CoA kinase [Candidatus Omnitrophota bacterium]
MRSRRVKLHRLLVGLTGGVGTGKSTAAGLFRRLGAQVFNLDTIAHQALKPDTPTAQAIQKRFGLRILDSCGRIERKKLAAVVFQSARKRKILESIVHPFVFRALEEKTRGKKGILVLEVPLLFETHFDKKMDVTIVVSARFRERLERLEDRHLGAAQLAARTQAQMPLAKKETLADFVIDNNGTRDRLKQQVVSIWKKLKLMAREENS